MRKNGGKVNSSSSSNNERVKGEENKIMREKIKGWI